MGQKQRLPRGMARRRDRRLCVMLDYVPKFPESRAFVTHPQPNEFGTHCRGLAACHWSPTALPVHTAATASWGDEAWLNRHDTEHGRRLRALRPPSRRDSRRISCRPTRLRGDDEMIDERFRQLFPSLQPRPHHRRSGRTKPPAPRCRPATPFSPRRGQGARIRRHGVVQCRE